MTKRRAKEQLDVVRPQVAAERILCLDVSSAIVGWAVFNNGLLDDAGAYVQRGDAHPEKLAHFRVWLRKMLVATKPDQLVFEAPYPGRNRNAFKVLSWYIGVVMCAYYEHFRAALPEGNAVAAHSVKRVLKMPKGRSHEENKKLSVLEVNRLYGLDLSLTDNDLSDAIQLGRAWILINRPDLAAEVA